MSFILFLSCEDRSELTEPLLPDTGEADFSGFVSIGNSLTAGMQSGALFESGQKYSIGNLIAHQVGVSFIQPTIDDPGIGGRIEVASLNPLSLKSRDLLAGLPNNLEYEGVYNNLGIPGALLEDLINATSSQTASDRSNLLFDTVLRGEGTVLELLNLAEPTLLTLWIGNNDILGFATSGGVGTYTPVNTFASLFDQLSLIIAQEEIPVFVANIPNVSTIPFFTTVAPSIVVKIDSIVAEDKTIDGFVYQTSAGSLFEIADGESLFKNEILITLRGTLAASFIGDREGKYYTSTGRSIPIEVDISFPFGLSEKNPFPNELVIDINEQTIIDNVISSYNATILAMASKYNFYLVNMNKYFDELSTNGSIIDGIKFTTEFIQGGLFSLDGVHPTSQGYAIIANRFIEEINDKLNADIPEINISTIPGSIEFYKRVIPYKRNISVLNSKVFHSDYY